ncbi:hypothetical protein MN116_008822 [Schistosoma mekongi]|uniref:RNA 3'-terminal phosphate cyclase domain-containing protein n=1 Tax=Schistosoma mekongi TaxID=38744 RepID=A0AAE2D173_SCHME|nr:hypothetical protein MN116_008822 [Schistosoma mekongi]
MVCSLVLEGHGNFRVKIALSLVSRKGLLLKHIRHKDNRPGVYDAEVCLLKLVDKLSNGTVININDRGTIVTVSPGTLIGGDFSFDCSNTRSIGYCVEFLLMIAPFCKVPIEATLTGISNNLHDPSIGMIAQPWLPIYRSVVGLSASASTKIDIRKRGVYPGGCAEVLFTSKPCSGIVPINKTEVRKVYRIRDVAWSCRVSPSYAQSLVPGAKSLLNQFLSDVYLTKDHRKGQYTGKSPGFGLTLSAERKDRGIYSAEAMSKPEGSGNVPIDAETVTFNFQYQSQNNPTKSSEENMHEERHDDSNIDANGKILIATCLGAGVQNINKSIR